MKRYTAILLSMLALALFSSCERRPLFGEDEATMRLVLNINLEIQNEPEEQELPQVMCASFFHRTERHREYREFVSGTGGLIAVPPGIYHLMAYCNDTYSTHVREDHHLNTIEAYSNRVHDGEDYAFTRWCQASRAEGDDDAVNFAGQPVVYEPSHFFVAKLEDVAVSATFDDDDPIIVQADAESIVSVYRIVIENVHNIKAVASANAFVSGQIQSVLIGTSSVESDPAVIFTELEVDIENERLTGLLHTFGQHPSLNNKIYLIIETIDTSGGHCFWDWDITDQFMTDDKGNELVVDEGIDVPEPQEPEPEEGGDWNPEASPWEEGQNTEINMGC